MGIMFFRSAPELPGDADGSATGSKAGENISLNGAITGYKKEKHSIISANDVDRSSTDGPRHGDAVPRPIAMPARIAASGRHIDFTGGGCQGQPNVAGRGFGMGDRVRKLYLHVGPAKTGTSAIQHLFRSHDDPRIVYPKVALWGDGAHHNLVFHVSGDFRRPEALRTDPRVLLQELRSQTRDTGRDILISSEALPAHDIGAFARALMPYLGEPPPQVEILFVCRDHFERAASLYNQQVKDFVTSESGEPDDFLRQNAARLTYAGMLRAIGDSGAKLTVINYHPAETLVARFLSAIGASLPPPPASEKRNVSLSPKGLIATLAANRAAGTAEERGRAFAALRRMRRFFAPSRFIFGREAAMGAEALFRADREALLHAYGIALPAPDLSQDNKLFITPAELQEIAAASAELGEQGEAITAFARRYTR